MECVAVLRIQRKSTSPEPNTYVPCHDIAAPTPLSEGSLINTFWSSCLHLPTWWFSWHMQLCGELGLSSWPRWFARSLPFPTHRQALDLESAALIVIYASTDDRCAHIVLSIRRRQLKVIARLGFNHAVSPPPPESGTVTAYPRWYSQIIRGCYFVLSRAKIQSLHSSKPWGREKKGVSCQENIRLEYNHPLEAISESGRSVAHFISQGYFQLPDQEICGMYREQNTAEALGVAPFNTPHNLLVKFLKGLHIVSIFRSAIFILDSSRPASRS